MKHIRFLLMLLLLMGSTSVNAQQLLNQLVSLNAESVPLSEVLNQIAKEGGFYFSYNSRIIKADSLVSLSVNKKTVKQALDLLFSGSLQYKETQGYIILHRAGTGQYWYISGYVKDGLSGEKLSNASIYEPSLLVGTVSNDDGYFRLLIKEKTNLPTIISISISRVSYEDTIITLTSGYSQEVELSIHPVLTELEGVVVNPEVQWSGLPRLFISSRLKKQSANLRNFLATRPVQLSFTPGLGTHGDLGAQVINKFSFNVLGGYTAGINGAEVAGLFNVNKKDAQYVQVAGLFNAVGADVIGLQVAGLHNKVKGSVTGMQVGGLYNSVHGSVKGFQMAGLMAKVGKQVEGAQLAGLISQVSGNMKGVQVSGLYSHVSDSMVGVQVAGLINEAGKKSSVTQIAGIGNICRHTTNHFQLAGIFNYTRKLEGWQIGLVNIADTLDGYSIGLLNISRKGYQSLSLSFNDLLDINLDYKAGNRNLYVILMAGMNYLRPKAWGVGYGLGNQLSLQRHIHLSNELFVQQFYNGTKNNKPWAAGWRCSASYKIHPKFQLFAGPSFNISSNVSKPGKGYASVIPDRSSFRIGSVKSWVGWQVGIGFSRSSFR